MNKFGAQNMYTELKTVLIKKPQPFMSSVDYKKWNYDYPLNQNLIDNNYKEFLNIIKKFDIEIIELKLRDEKNELCDSIFTHDPSLITNEGAVILNMGKEIRKPETIEHEELYKSLEIPIIDKLDDNATVEGGDCLWVNNKLLLIGKSSRTNIKGINQMQEILKRINVTVVPVDLPLINNNSCFHLMSIVSILDQDLIIGYKKHMSDDLINILNKNSIKLIEIPEEEYINSKTLAVNILSLSPRNLVLLKGYPMTCEILLKENCVLNLFSGNELCIKTEGGPTCLTRPIWRI